MRIGITQSGGENVTQGINWPPKKELPGYDAYMAQVKYRLIPYVW